jgi:hypothetical protein
MPNPSQSLATLRPDLAGGLIEFDLAMDRMGFIGLRIFPVIESGLQAGSFGRIPIEQLLQTRDTRRAPGSGYSRSDFKFTPDSFATQENGAEEPLDDRQQAMYASYFDFERIKTQRAFDAVLRNHEIRVAAKVFNTSTWTGEALTTALSTPWSNHDDATPIDDIEAAKLKIWNGSGLWPNTLTINKLVFNHLRQCAQIKDAITSGGAGNAAKLSDITAAMLAQVFDVEEILVAGSPKNTANEGATAPTIAPIWSSTYAMLASVARSQDLEEPCIGRTIHWGEDGSQIGGTVETYRDESIRGNVVRVRHDTDEKVLYPEAGHLLSAVAV